MIRISVLTFLLYLFALAESRKKYCTDKTRNREFCQIHRDLGHCKWQYVADQCKRTCDLCSGTSHWLAWSEWSTCSHVCGGGRRLRTKSCSGETCNGVRRQLEDCAKKSCTRLFIQTSSAVKEAAVEPSMSGRLVGSKPMGRLTFNDEEKESEHKCGAFEFLCDKTTCLDVVKKCDGYDDCLDQFDEGACMLGVKSKSRVIMNWERHTCLTVNISEAGVHEPRWYKRCPGPLNPWLREYWWYWRLFYNLVHSQSGKCLGVDLPDPPKRNRTRIVLKTCNIEDDSQRLMCENMNLKLKNHLTFLPDDLAQHQYIGFDPVTLGLELKTKENFSESTTDFHTFHTDRINICGVGNVGFLPMYTATTVCSKTCGNGTKRVLKSCAQFGRSSCGDSSMYEIVACNTHPCTRLCPDGWSAMVSEFIEGDINCFKAFEGPSTYLEAHKTCAVNNWTLAADKNAQTHDFIAELHEFSEKHYIGAFANLQIPTDSAVAHSLTFSADGTPVGGFAPWNHYGTEEEPEGQGCVLRSGGTFFGKMSETTDGRKCNIWRGGVNSTQVQLPGRLDPPYFSPLSSGEENSCRNPTLDVRGPWCYTGKHNVTTPCNVTDCLEILEEDGSGTKWFPDVDPHNLFLIHSMLDADPLRPQCLAATVPDSFNPNSVSRAQLQRCDVDDEHQHFWWWSTNTLVNVGSRACLTAETDVAKAGQGLLFRPCDEKLATLSQAWHAEGRLLIPGLVSTKDNALPTLLKVVVRSAKSTAVTITDRRTSLFVGWTKAEGMTRLDFILSETLPGPYVLLNSSCGYCVKHDYLRTFGLLRSEPCSPRDLTQRWVLLPNGHMMNVASAKCLAGFRMQAYPVATRCDAGDFRQVWRWKKDITAELANPDWSTIEHVQTGFYLSCKCAGLSDLCLTPSAGTGNTTWTFMPKMPKKLKRARSGIVVEVPSAGRGSQGYPFLLQSTSNLTLCARPSLPKGSNATSTRMDVLFDICVTGNQIFFWYFTGFVSQIKHHLLDLCIDAPLDLENFGTVDQVQMKLMPCNESRLAYQTWVFRSGPLPRDGNGLPGDFIRFGQNESYFLDVGEVEDQPGMFLLLKEEKGMDRWEAVTLLTNSVGIGEMRDCALPWQKMSTYRGTRTWTRNGFRCQPWASMVPHRHSFHPDNFTDHGLDGNFCRKPPAPANDIMDKKDEDHAWCLTLNPRIPWQDCLVPKCPLPATVVIDHETKTWEVAKGDGAYGFTCQLRTACYHGNGFEYQGFFNWSSRAFCKNWRKYNGGDRRYPDHDFCANPTKTMIQPWCWVHKGVAQYCEHLEKCPLVCKMPVEHLTRMKILNIKYTSPSKMFAIGSKMQLVCREGYNVTLKDKKHVQEIVCQNDGTWSHREATCRKITCPPPANVSNAQLLTPRARYLYGGTVAYLCREGFMVRPARIMLEMTCLKTGNWSLLDHKCVAACRPGWVSFDQKCILVKSEYDQFNSYKMAEEICQKEGGSLAVPTNQVMYGFIKWLIGRDSGHTAYEYWMGVKDFGSNDQNLTKRWWKSGNGKLDTDKLYMGTMKSKYHSFKIRILGSTVELQGDLAYIDRCMLGNVTTKEVTLGSCSFEGSVGMVWTWLTYQLLYNVNADLCLSSKQYTRVGGDDIERGTIFLSECDLNNEDQKFTCGPYNGYLLKPRNAEGSFVSAARLDGHGRVSLGGHHRTGPMSMWQAYPDGRYLCHWEIKPPDPFFVVHRGTVPSFNSFTLYEPEKCMTNRTGAVLADLELVERRGIPEFGTNWCSCLYMRQTDDPQVGPKDVNAAPLQNDACALSNNKAEFSSSPGVHVCELEQEGDSLCTRRDGTNPIVMPIPSWCVAMKVHSPEKHNLLPRNCADRMAGLVCEADARWACPIPFQPPHTVPQLQSENYSDMKFAFGRTITVRCETGYSFPKPLKTALVTCNQHLEWELAKTSTFYEPVSYMDTREERQRAISQLECFPINCSTPIQVSGMNLAVHSDLEDIFPYGTNASYTCVTGTILKSGRLEHNITCTGDGTWQKPIGLHDVCITTTCGKPPLIDHSTRIAPADVFGAVALYICDDAYNFKRGQDIEYFNCTATGEWVPDPLSRACDPISCSLPTAKQLKAMHAVMIPEREFVYFNNNITYRCLPGFWLDKKMFELKFSCQITGEWLPVHPSRMKCTPVMCREPVGPPRVIQRGSDRRAGNEIRYECESGYWTRQSFRLYSPDRGVCIHVTGGQDQGGFYYNVTGDHPVPGLKPGCIEQGTSRDLWVWHWSFHLRNKYTGLCLAAPGIPTIKEDLFLVEMRECNKSSVQQHWQCANTPDGSPARLIFLRATVRGGYLTILGDPTGAVGDGDGAGGVFKLAVSGDKNSGGVESFWQAYSTLDSKKVDACSFRDGRPYATTVCNSYGEWNPPGTDVECSPVDCGEPPQLRFSTQIIMRGRQSEVDDLVSQFSAPNWWEHHRNNYLNVSSFPVNTIVAYQCDVGKWVSRGVHNFSIKCYGNGYWGPYKSEFTSIQEDVCVDVTCPKPSISKNALVWLRPPSRYDVAGGDSPRFGQSIVYRLGVNETYVPLYNARASVQCELGYWNELSRAAKLSEADPNAFAPTTAASPADGKNSSAGNGTEAPPVVIEVGPTPPYGSNVVEAVCRPDGNWSAPLLNDAIECLPVKCPTPPKVNFSTRSPETLQDIFDFDTVFQYQCEQGYWFTPARVYTESKCSKNGTWEPHPGQMACVVAQCRDPGPVVSASKSGFNFSVGSNVTYTCLAGHLIDRKWSARDVMCQGDGLWFPPPHTVMCKQFGCEDFPEIEHAVHFVKKKQYQYEFVAGDRVDLYCENGYTFDSTTFFMKVACSLEGEWIPDISPATTRNLCKPVHCPSPPLTLPSGARLISQSLRYRHTDTVTYKCPTGQWLGPDDPYLTLTGTCDVTVNGVPEYVIQWLFSDEEATCVDVPCRYPGFIQHAKLSWPAGSKYATYHCDLGYHIASSGNFTKTMEALECNSAAEWMPWPGNIACEPVTCADPGAVGNAVRQVDPRPGSPLYYYGDVLEFACVNGMQFVDSVATTRNFSRLGLWKSQCMFDGTWDRLPQNEYFACRPVACLIPLVIPLANVTTNLIDPELYPYYPVGTGLSVECVYGYVSSAVGNRLTNFTCGDQGLWEPFSPDLVQCEPLYCNDPGERANATRYSEGFGYRDHVTYHGFIGFEALLDGDTVRTTSVTLECDEQGAWKVVNQTQLLDDKEGTAKRRKRATEAETHVTFVPITCQPPLLSPNSTIEDLDDSIDSYPLGSTLSVGCTNSSFIALTTPSVDITCLELGGWWPVPMHIRCLPSEHFNCPIPNVPENAVMMSTSYGLDKGIPIHCVPGYEFEPGVNEWMINCTSGGTWTPDPIPTNCSLITCENPPELEHTVLNFTGTNFNSQAHYRCTEGYSFSNQSVFISICRSHNSWIPDPLLISCDPIDCGPPSYIRVPNALPLNFSTTTVESVATTVCAEGFVLADGEELFEAVCEANGYWRPNRTARCMAISCGPPTPVLNSRFKTPDGFAFQSRAFFRCVPGYRVNPPGGKSQSTDFNMTCSSSGIWETPLSKYNVFFTCVPTACPDLPVVDNSRMIYPNVNTSFILGGKTYYECNEGFTTGVYGPKVEMTCMWHGQFEPDPNTIVCKPKLCEDPPIMEHATGAGGKQVGDVWTYTCQTGYDVKFGVKAVAMSCTEKTWWVPHFTQLDKCRIKACHKPKELPMSSNLYTSDGERIEEEHEPYFPIGGTVTYRCFPGYFFPTVKGPEQTSTCLAGDTWDPPEFEDCAVVTCAGPPSVADTKTTGVLQSDQYSYNASVSYTCPFGKHFRKERRQTLEFFCTDNGRFKPEASRLRCSTSMCEDYEMPNALRIFNDKLEHGGMATYECGTGYWFEHKARQKNFTCDLDGRWKPDTNRTNCKPVRCAMPQVERMANEEKFVQYNEPVKLRCVPGYYVNGESKMSCEKDGGLNPPGHTLECQPVPCPEPQAPEFSAIDGDWREYNKTVAIMCDPGYWVKRFHNFLILLCQEDGTWSTNPEKVRCTPVWCDTPGPFENGTLIGDYVNGSLPYLHKYTITCDPGLWVVHSRLTVQVSLCGVQGKWVPAIPPSCVRIVCPEPPPMDKATLTYKNMSDSAAIYACDPLYWIAIGNLTHWVLSGQKHVRAMCSETGDWKPMPNKDFVCNSIYQGDTGKKELRTLSADRSRGLPFKQLVRNLPSSWMTFDPDSMTIWDGNVRHDPKQNVTVTSFVSNPHRDVTFIWDHNPLTFWQGADATSSLNDVNDTRWMIEVHLGVTRAVSGVMVMCADDGRSDVTSFSMVFAGADKVPNKIGPFRVYGDFGISGKPRPDFDLSYSSVATPWVFGGFLEEVLWLHLILDGAVAPGIPPAIREIGLLASEVEWEPAYPLNPIPGLLIGSALLLLVAVASPFVYYLQSRRSATALRVPQESPLLTCFDYELAFEFRRKSASKRGAQLLIYPSFARLKKVAVLWLRGDDDSSKLFRSRAGHCSVALSLATELPFEDFQLKLFRLNSSEHPFSVSSSVGGETDELGAIRLTDLRNCREWTSARSKKGRRHKVANNKVTTVHMRAQEQNTPFQSFASFLGCHLLVSIVNPPRNTPLTRMDRLMTALATTAVSTLATLYFQLIFAPSEPLESREVAIAFAAAVAIFGAVTSLPLPTILRYLYAGAGHLCKGKPSKRFLYRFCTHGIFAHRSEPRLPFSKTLAGPLLELLDVAASDPRPVDVATQCLDDIMFDSDSGLARRWSNPDMGRSAVVPLRLASSTLPASAPPKKVPSSSALTLASVMVHTNAEGHQDLAGVSSQFSFDSCESSISQLATATDTETHESVDLELRLLRENDASKPADATNCVEITDEHWGGAGQPKCRVKCEARRDKLKKTFPPRKVKTSSTIERGDASCLPPAVTDPESGDIAVDGFTYRRRELERDNLRLDVSCSGDEILERRVDPSPKISSLTSALSSLSFLGKRQKSFGAPQPSGAANKKTTYGVAGNKSSLFTFSSFSEEPTLQLPRASEHDFLSITETSASTEKPLVVGGVSSSEITAEIQQGYEGAFKPSSVDVESLEDSSMESVLSPARFQGLSAAQTPHNPVQLPVQGQNIPDFGGEYCAKKGRLHHTVLTHEHNASACFPCSIPPGVFLSWLLAALTVTCSLCVMLLGNRVSVAATSDVYLAALVSVLFLWMVGMSLDAAVGLLLFDEQRAYPDYCIRSKTQEESVEEGDDEESTIL